jgi:hypothetical protein
MLRRIFGLKGEEVRDGGENYEDVPRFHSSHVILCSKVKEH